MESSNKSWERSIRSVFASAVSEAVSLTLMSYAIQSEVRKQASTLKTTEDVFGLGVIYMRKPMDRSRDSEAVPETRRAPVDRLRQILMGHYNRK